MTAASSIKTSKAELYISERGHIVIRIFDKQDLEPEDILEINRAKEKLADGKKYTVVFKTGQYCSISAAARKLSASDVVYRNAIAKAIVAESISERMIGNFFININKPPAPTRVVRSEAEAFEWLEHHILSHSN